MAYEIVYIGGAEMKNRVLCTLMMIPFLLFYAIPTTGAAEKEENWQDELIYFIMVDRFYNGNQGNDSEINTDDPGAYHGGDLQGIIDKLDYIKELGFTSISLTPIMENQSGGYHGYWITDFMKVEEQFGTMADAKKLVEEAHQRDMKVIFDFVVNHTGSEHPWIDDPEKEDWFHEETTENSQQQLEEGWGNGLPDLKQENPEVKQYFMDVAEYWIEETGVDGFRLDTAQHVPKSFWEDFSDHVKSIDEDFFLLGEVKSEDPSYLAEYQQAGIDSFADYPFYNAATKVFQQSGEDLDPLFRNWKRNQDVYDNPGSLGIFVDNLDTKRFTRLTVVQDENPVTRWKLALTYMYGAPGIPIVMYGTEIPLDGGEDPDNRKMMNFKTGDTKVKQYMEKLAALRQQFPVLTRGDFEQVVMDGAFGVFKRTYEDQVAYLVINNSEQTKVATLDEIPDGKQLRGYIHDDIVRTDQNGEAKLALDREMADIYILEEEQGINYLFIAAMVGIIGGFVAFVIIVSRKNKQETSE